MPRPGRHHYHGPAGTYAAGRLSGNSASTFSGPPPSYSSHNYGPTQSNYLDEERRPLLSGFPTVKSDGSVPAAKRLFLLAIAIIWPMAYFAYSLVFVPSQVALYKNLYDDARVQVHHLVSELSRQLKGAFGQGESGGVLGDSKIYGYKHVRCESSQFTPRLQCCSGMSGWEQMIQVVDLSFGRTGSRTANTTTTTLRSPPHEYISPPRRQPSSSPLTGVVWLVIESNRIDRTMAGGWPRA
jgi:hypothetical protein